jgi:poly(hydroxyalkanoate) granule-associated protein
MDTNADINKENEKTEEYSIQDMMRRMMLAGFGAVSIIYEELEQHIDKLVERGEIAEKDREETLKKMKERREKIMQHGKEFKNKHFAEALEHFEVPNKTDIDSLNQKIADLEKKIDELNKAKV